MLGEHRPGQQMRPGRSAEGQEEIGALPLLLIVAVSRTDQESHLPLAAVAPAFEEGGELTRRQSLAALVENHRNGIGSGGGRVLAATIRKLGNFGRPIDPL